MKQVVQNYKTGELKLEEVPTPICNKNSVLVKNVRSLISIGTERSIIELGKKSLLGKARARPDLVKRFIDKAKKEGILKTFSEAMGRLDSPTPLGYSSSGVVLEVGENVHLFSKGDRVSCIGAGYASHAEVITVPQMLCARIPDNVTFDEASFGMLGIIALHGIRSGKINFGESVAVVGLGLLGLLSVQILKSYGCQVIATDIDPSKMEMAKILGADRVIALPEFKDSCQRFTDGIGVDCVILTVATKSSEPVITAVDVSRFGGRIVLVGVADVHPDRNEMWHKEVEIIVSRAGGAGIFDIVYENGGIDYPPGYVRWTERRNLQEFLRLIDQGLVKTSPLITHRYSIDDAELAYREMLNGINGPHIAVLLEYSNNGASCEKNDKLVRLKPPNISKNNNINIGVIGAGLFGKALLLPSLRKVEGINFHTIATLNGANAQHVGNKYGFLNCTTDYSEVLNNGAISAVIIATPHSSHASIVCKAIDAGKHVFVEKPLCINELELSNIVDAYNKRSDLLLMVGYNRRFSKLSYELKKFFDGRLEPMVINYRINSGYVPPEHWVHSPDQGGSRIIGEVCHFVDMIQFITAEIPERVYAERVQGNNKTVVNSDNVVVSIKFDRGSVASIVYSACGDKSFSRERIEVFNESKTAVLDDYRTLLLQKGGKKKFVKLSNQDMGYECELKNFVNNIKGGNYQILPPLDIFKSTMTVFKINESLESGAPAFIG